MTIVIRTGISESEHYRIAFRVFLAGDKTSKLSFDGMANTVATTRGNSVRANIGGVVKKVFYKLQITAKLMAGI